MKAITPAIRSETAKNFLNFVNSTGSPFHSVAAVKSILRNSGFLRLDENIGFPKQLERGKKYYITRNHSSIIAFIVSKNFNIGTGGFLIAGSHTDSPSLRIRPSPELISESVHLVNVETYGGGLWHTWFDRGLGLAGKVVIKNNETNALTEKLVRINKPVVFIPNLAIHLQTAEERAAFKVNTELHLRPVLCSQEKLTSSSTTLDNSSLDLNHIKILIASSLKCSPHDIVGIDISLMDATESRTCGMIDEFIESPRIDNLASVWAGFEALSTIPDNVINNSHDIFVSASFDHEEVGSQSYTGANSTLLDRWLHQILLGILGQDDAETFSRIAVKSFLLSTDSAHGVHPNYADKHQAQHKPILQQGVVIKENCNQRYASHATSMALTQRIAECSDDLCLLQNFVVRNNSPCGSTIGPIVAAQLGIRTVDVGVPQWAMHSIREFCGIDDLFYLRNLIASMYTHFRDIDNATEYI